MKKRERPSYTLIDHTADIGIRVRGKTQKELFEKAALALTNVIVSPGPHGKPTAVRLSVSGEDPADLLVRWMGEILYLFEGESGIVEDVHIETLTSNHLEAVVLVFPFDPDRDESLNHVKGVTYHQASVTEAYGRWEAFVILDV